MSVHKIIVTDYYYPNLDAEKEVFARLGDYELVDCTRFAPGGYIQPEHLIPHVCNADAVIVQFAQINAEVIKAMQRCKVIARYAIGVDNIDLDAAKAKGILVANVPDYCVGEVADTAAAHILNAARKLTASRDLLMDGAFSIGDIRPMQRLECCTLSLLGFGNIARNLAGKMRPFFGRILAYDPYFTAQADYPWVEFLGLDEVVSQADVISVHLPLQDATRNMINAEMFARMKHGVLLVNTARGGVFDEAALISALDDGTIAYAGLDVLINEQFTSSPLLRHPKVALTPHIAWCSEQALRELQRKTAENVVDTLLLGRPKYLAR